MAGSRRAKFIPLLERATGLLKSGVIKERNTPLWYNVYKAFPPNVVPDYNRLVPDQNIPKILYPEDIHRAFINKHPVIRRGHFNLFKMEDNDSIGAKFLKVVNKLKDDNLELNEKHLKAVKQLEALWTNK